MKTIFAAATLCVLGAVGVASAHPTGDGHHFRAGYFQPHAQPSQPYAYQPQYRVQQYRQPYHARQRYASPAYAQPHYSAPQPAYHGGYPSQQQAYVQPPQYNAAPRSYGYRGANPNFAPRFNGFGANNSRSGVDTESYNFGYAGGPTFAIDRQRPVINGVEVFGPPND